MPFTIRFVWKCQSLPPHERTFQENRSSGGYLLEGATPTVCVREKKRSFRYKGPWGPVEGVAEPSSCMGVSFNGLGECLILIQLFVLKGERGFLL